MILITSTLQHIPFGLHHLSGLHYFFSQRHPLYSAGLESAVRDCLLPLSVGRLLNPHSKWAVCSGDSRETCGDAFRGFSLTHDISSSHFVLKKADLSLLLEGRLKMVFE